MNEGGSADPTQSLQAMKLDMDNEQEIRLFAKSLIPNFDQIQDKSEAESLLRSRIKFVKKLRNSDRDLIRICNDPKKLSEFEKIRGNYYSWLRVKDEVASPASDNASNKIDETIKSEDITQSILNLQDFKELIDLIKPDELEKPYWLDCNKEIRDIDISSLEHLCISVDIIHEGLNKYQNEIANYQKKKDYIFAANKEDDKYFVERMLKSMNLSLDYTERFVEIHSETIPQNSAFFKRIFPPIPDTRRSELLKAAFKQKYMGMTAQSLSNYIVKINQFKLEEEWHSHSFPIIQSSGYGKTKTVVELAELRDPHYVILSCFRPQSSTGYPKSPSHVVILQAKLSLATTDENAKAIWTDFFWQNINYLKNSKLKEPAHIEKQENGIDLPTNCSKDLEYLASITNKKPLVFAVDETTNLLQLNPKVNLLAAWKRFLEQYNGRVVGVYTDTYSNATTLCPPGEFDPSLRVRLKGRSVFPPFLTFSVDVHNVYPLINKTYKDYTNDPDYLDKLYRLGRPLWAGYRTKELPTSSKDASKTEISTFDEVLGVAHDKLGSQYDLDTEIAVVVLRTSITLRSNRYASSIVSSHMGTLIGFSPDRHILTSLYLPEPVLQHAATKIFIDKKVEAIRALDYLLIEQQINSGLVGEHVAEIILLNGADQSRSKEHQGNVTDDVPMLFATPITVSQFVEGLFGAELAGTILGMMSPRLRNAKVNLHKFTYMLSKTENMKHFTQETLMKAFVYQVGLSMRSNFPAIDFVVPVLLNPNDIPDVIAARASTGTRAPMQVDISPAKSMQEERVHMQQADVYPLGHVQAERVPMQVDTASVKRQKVDYESIEESNEEEYLNYCDDTKDITLKEQQDARLFSAINPEATQTAAPADSPKVITENEVPVIMPPPDLCSMLMFQIKNVETSAKLMKAIKSLNIPIEDSSSEQPLPEAVAGQHLVETDESDNDESATSDDESAIEESLNSESQSASNKEEEEKPRPNRFHKMCQRLNLDVPMAGEKGEVTDDLSKLPCFMFFVQLDHGRIIDKPVESLSDHINKKQQVVQVKPPLQIQPKSKNQQLQSQPKSKKQQQETKPEERPRPRPKFKTMNGCIVNMKHLGPVLEKDKILKPICDLLGKLTDPTEAGVMQYAFGNATNVRINDRLSEIATRLPLVVPNAAVEPNLNNDLFQQVNLIKGVQEMRARALKKNETMANKMVP